MSEDATGLPVPPSFPAQPAFDDAERLLELVRPGASADRFWGPEELDAILEHQLAAPLVADLRTLGSAEAIEASQLAKELDPPIRTFGDLFQHPAPPAKLLHFVKLFAQIQLHAGESELPKAVAVFLYDAAIVVARLRCGESITSLPDAKLSESICWLLEQPWLEPRYRVLLRKGIEFLSAAT